MSFNRAAFRLLRVAVNVALAVVLLVNLTMALGPRVAHVRFAQERSGSMTPMIPVGGLVVYRPSRANAVVPRQVISFHLAGYRAIVTHRVLSTSTQRGTTSVVTRGDANPARDRQISTFPARQTVWHAVAVLPAWAGRILADVGQRGLLLALGLMPLAWLLPWCQGQLVGPSPRRRQQSAA